MSEKVEPPFAGEVGKVRNRRNLVIAGRPGERPFTIRFADLRYRALPALGLLSSRATPSQAAWRPAG